MAKTAKKSNKSKKKEEVKDNVLVTKDPVVKKIENTLRSLYTVQKIDSQVDRIRNIRGELPLEVQDLEDEIIGLETRLSNYKSDIEEFEKTVTEKQNGIKESEALIKKYKDQQMNVRNNREYDSLSKEMEFQALEIQLADKRIKENKELMEQKNEEIKNSEEILEERKKDIEVKKDELKDIVTETEKEEKELLKKSKSNQENIEERLLIAYKRIRKNAKNGLAVVQVERDACGGCFSKIPPQHQLDIKMHKKIIVCEYCGRILVDDEIANQVDSL